MDRMVGSTRPMGVLMCPRMISTRSHTERLMPSGSAQRTPSLGPWPAPALRTRTNASVNQSLTSFQLSKRLPPWIPGVRVAHVNKSYPSASMFNKKRKTCTRVPRRPRSLKRRCVVACAPRRPKCNRRAPTSSNRWCTISAWTRCDTADLTLLILNVDLST